MVIPPFASRYGPWAIVAGASEGIGAAFARALAERGLNLVLVARRAPPLVALAGELQTRHKVSVQPLPLDLGEPESIAELLSVTGDREIGLLVWNAALSVLGPFLDQSVDAHLVELELNVRSPMRAVHALGGRMVARRRGGIILLSSLSGMQGTALIANYAATKAWNRVLAEGLWWELGKNGVDVLACVVGATDTPGYRSSAPAPGSDNNVPVQSPETVAVEALAALGKRPGVITGMKNRLAAAFLARLLPRKAAVKLMGRTMDRMYGGGLVRMYGGRMDRMYGGGMQDAMAPVERLVVDNRLFIIGLDQLYRSAMAKFETTRLLECARTVARVLEAAPSAAPVEGYYVESTALTEYFQLMRTLQELPGSAAGRVRHLPEFSLLYAIATSGLYGQAEGDHLLPRGKDALGRALEDITAREWTVTRLVERARTVATETDDFSLVALAARTGDAVCLAATRESVALYSRIIWSGESPRTAYDWRVDGGLSAAANRFIQTLNQFVTSPLPAAEAASAAAYYEAAMDAKLAGRCVAIAFDPATSRYYHWAVAGESMPELHVREFWDPELWTTARHKSQGLIISGS